MALSRHLALENDCPGCGITQIQRLHRMEAWSTTGPGTGPMSNSHPCKQDGTATLPRNLPASAEASQPGKNRKQASGGHSRRSNILN